MGYYFIVEDFLTRSIIDDLQKQDVVIEQLCEKIEQVPTFNHFLMYTASQDNRLQLPVKSIKQAVLTYGIERVGDMLIQFALLERLTQNQFPLMGLCKQITLLACSLLIGMFLSPHMC